MVQCLCSNLKALSSIADRKKGGRGGKGGEGREGRKERGETGGGKELVTGQPKGLVATLWHGQQCFEEVFTELLFLRAELGGPGGVSEPLGRARWGETFVPQSLS
jgi:hypothetical protein